MKRELFVAAVIALGSLVAGGVSCIPGRLGSGTDTASKVDVQQVADGPSAQDSIAGEATDGRGAVDGGSHDRKNQDRPAATKDGPVVTKDGPVVTKDGPVVTKDRPVVADTPPAVKDKPPATTDRSSTGGPTIVDCPVFPVDNPWNTDISSDPVDPNSDTIIATINASGSGQYLHPDFSSTGGYNPPYGGGIPYNVVPGSQPKVCMTFSWATESDPGPYPFPPNPLIEGGPTGGGDRHVLVIDKDNCKLYETGNSTWDATSSCWTCGAGAVFDLKSNALRPDCWTSADAAGLPIFAGLVRYEEAVRAGEIKHAIRATFDKTRQAYLHPATHFASSDTDANLPPMGLRLRLKASYSTGSFTGAAKAVMLALQKYGMIVADNGSNWYISGAPDPGWDDKNLDTLKQVPGTAFEVVKPSGKLYTAADCP